MESQNSKQATLVIAGMHRSGTSLVASILQNAGLHIGSRLMGPMGNGKGHFEDLDFVAFHISALESQGLANTGFTLQRDIRIGEQHFLRARELVDARSRGDSPWGWKDPRTVLFLDFWQPLVPEANFLILYRSPWEVVDSLFRRGDEAFRTNPGFAVRVWVHYNQLLLNFHDRHPERCLCVSSHRAAQSPVLLLEALAQKFGLRLEPVANLFEEPLFRKYRSWQWASLLQHHFPEAIDLYEELNERARNGPLPDGALAEEAAQTVPAEDWVLKDWLDLRAMEGQCGALRQQLEQSQGEAVALREALGQAQGEAASLHAALNQAQGEAASLREELRQSRNQLHEAREEITNMASSKFWKLRKTWFYVKHGLRRSA